MKHPVAIRSLACALPERRVPNDGEEFRTLWNELPESWWRFWGIQQRPMMNRQRETARSMARTVCEQALRDAQLEASEVDLVLTAVSSPILQDGDRMRMFPRISTELCRDIGACNAVSWDVELECVSFLLLLQQAVSFVRTGKYKRVLICTAETISLILDYTSKDSTTFGDGAAAAIIERADNGGDMLASAWTSNGEYYPVATMRIRRPAAGGPKSVYFTLAPDGSTRMMEFVPKTVPSVVHRALSMAQVGVDDVAQFIFHQPGTVLIDAWAQGVSEACGGDISGRYFVAVREHGSLVSVAIPSTLLLAVGQGLIKPGDTIVLAGLGTGWGYGAQVWRWGNTRVSTIVPTESVPA